MKILKIIVFITHGEDEIHIETDLPCPYSVEVDPFQFSPVMIFKVPHRTGEAYVLNNFEMKPEINYCQGA